MAEFLVLVHIGDVPVAVVFSFLQAHQALLQITALGLNRDRRDDEVSLDEVEGIVKAQKDTGIASGPVPAPSEFIDNTPTRPNTHPRVVTVEVG